MENKKQQALTFDDINIDRYGFTDRDIFLIVTSNELNEWSTQEQKYILDKYKVLTFNYNLK